MILNDQNIRSKDSSSSSYEEEVLDSEEEILSCERELLLVRRLLRNQAMTLLQSQHENLFHTRCKIFKNVCFVIVDIGSSFNSCNTRLVEKLALTTKPHPNPYKLEWIKDDGGIVVKESNK